VQEIQQAEQYGLEAAKAAEFHYILARAYWEQEKYEEAVREYEQAIELGFGDAQTHGAWFNRLARDLIGNDIDIDKGVAYAQKSLELDPDQNPARAMDTLALGYIKQGRHAEAVKLLEQALEKAPDNETLLERMQQAQEGLKTME
jgi:tetratricopeptide (TPR) repeat protein